MANRILAVHLYADRIELAAAESTLRTLRITKMWSAPSSAAEQAAATIKSEHWDRVVASLPAGVALFRLLDLPFHDRHRIGQAIGPALEGQVPMSLEDGITSWDYCDPDHHGSLLAVMVAREALDLHLADLARYAISPDRLLWTPSLVLETYRRALDTEPDRALIDVGADGAVIAVHRENRLTGLRIVRPCTDDILLRNAAWELQTLSPACDRVVVGGQYGDRVRDALAQLLPTFTVTALPIGSPVEIAPSITRPWQTATALVGLVLAAAQALSAPAIEFLQGTGDSTTDRAGQALRRLGPWAACALGLLLAASALDWARLARERRSLEQSAAEIVRPVLPAAAGEPGMRLKLKMLVDELAHKRTEIGGSPVQTSPLTFLAAISTVLPPDLDVEFDAYTYDPPLVRLSGHGGSFETVTRLQDLLQASGRFATVEVGDARAAVSGSGVDFELSIQLAEKGASS